MRYQNGIIGPILYDIFAYKVPQNLLQYVQIAIYSSFDRYLKPWS